MAYRKWTKVNAGYLIFCDAGHIEVGNELPPERQIIAALNAGVSRDKFGQACEYCEKHHSENIDLVERNPDLEQDTSTFYWWVILLRLPKRVGLLLC
jgi:hypothetical protein